MGRRSPLRRAFALTDQDDGQAQRQKLFKGFDALNNISAEQRIGAGFIVNGELRAWFDTLALQAIGFLDELEEDDA